MAAKEVATAKEFYWQSSVSSAGKAQELRASPNAEDSSGKAAYHAKVSDWLGASDEDRFHNRDEAEGSCEAAEQGSARGGPDNAESYEATTYFDSAQTWDAHEKSTRAGKEENERAGRQDFERYGSSKRVDTRSLHGNAFSPSMQELGDIAEGPVVTESSPSPNRSTQTEASKPPTPCTPSVEMRTGVKALGLNECFMDRRMSSGASSVKRSRDFGQESESESFTEDFSKVYNSWIRVANDSEALTRYPGEFVIAVNSGGSSSASCASGIEYLKDQLFLGGDVLRTEEDISETSEPSLYQTARYGNISYKLTDLSCGEYFVDLHFAEIVFTNGPAGMRVFDVHIQGQKVISGLDVYSEVGSNKALVLCGKTSVKGGTLLIVFEGVIGNPTVSALCVRRAPNSGIASSVPGRGPVEGKFHVRPAVDNSPDVGEEKDSLPPLMVEHKSRRQQLRSKARKNVLEYEAKLEELKKECHEAWLSLQDANRQIEQLQNDVVLKTCTIDTLADVVESQNNEMKELREKAEGGLGRWKIAAAKLLYEIQEVKANYGILAQESKDWICSFPDASGMVNSVQTLLNEHELLKRKYAEESQERRQLYNKVLELKGNIRVFCRCRPLSAFEMTSGASSVVDFDAVKDNELIVRTGNGKKLFKFDRVFTPLDNQGEVFASTAPVVVSVLDGYNVCIFAYGQTGTGKTFTMEGTPDDRGVNYRTLEELFHIAEQRKAQFRYEITVSVLEVYNEQIRDLLAPPPEPEHPVKKLEIRQVSDGGHHVPGLLEAKVTSMEEVWDVLQSGSSARAVESTNANEHSSRSHCMLCVMVFGQNLITGEATRSKLWLVDLAGSERVAKTDVHGERLKEAQSINKSLSALGDVIAALTTKNSHIPFRNSKLTHLLQDSLGGDSKTLMFVQIGPSDGDAGESLCSLNFASRVRGIELGPARKQIDSSELFKYKQLVERSKQEGRTKEEAVKKLEDSLRNTEVKLKVKDHLYQALLDKMKDKEKVVTDLEAQLAAEKKARLAAQLEKPPTSKDLRGLPERRPLMEKTIDASDGSHAKAFGTGSPVEKGKPQNENADPQKRESSPDAEAPTKPVTARTKVVPSRYNSPTTIRLKVPRRPARASIASTYQINSSTMTSSFSSEESGCDAGGKENFRLLNGVRDMQHKRSSAVDRPAASSAVPTTAASNLPRRKAVHFASPVFQKEKIGESRTVSRGEDIQPRSYSVPYHERSMSLGGASDAKKLGVGKLRRVSIVRTSGTRLPTGGAQRVLSVAAAAALKSGVPPLQSQSKERRWNK